MTDCPTYLKYRFFYKNKAVGLTIKNIIFLENIKKNIKLVYKKMPTYKFNMYDDYGDGWDGAKVNILVNDILKYSDVTLTSGEYDYLDIEVNYGDIITLADWVDGEFPEEVTWSITNELKQIRASGGVNDTAVVDVIGGYDPSLPIPTGLTGSNITYNSVDLSWNEESGITEYVIEYGLSGFTLGEGLLKLVDMTYDILSALDENSDYDVYVRSYLDGYYSDYSSVYSFRTESAILPVPTGLTVSNVLSGTVNLSWTSNGLNYLIQFGKSGFNLGDGFILTSENNSYLLSGMSELTSYDVYVQSTDGYFYSEWSEPVSFTTIEREANNYYSYIGSNTDPYVPNDAILINPFVNDSLLNGDITSRFLLKSGNSSIYFNVGSTGNTDSWGWIFEVFVFSKDEYKKQFSDESRYYIKDTYFYTYYEPNTTEIEYKIILDDNNQVHYLNGEMIGESSFNILTGIKGINYYVAQSELFLESSVINFNESGKKYEFNTNDWSEYVNTPLDEIPNYPLQPWRVGKLLNSLIMYLPTRSVISSVFDLTGELYEDIVNSTKEMQYFIIRDALSSIYNVPLSTLTINSFEFNSIDVSSSVIGNNDPSQFEISMNNSTSIVDAFVNSANNNNLGTYTPANLTLNGVDSRGSIVEADGTVISFSCFGKGSLVETNKGKIAIEDIDENIHKIKDNKVIALTQSIYGGKNLVLIKKDAISMNVPDKDTIITGEHSIYINGIPIQAKKLVDKYENIELIPNNNKIVYNVIIENQGGMNVNNLNTESLNHNNQLAKLYMNYNDKERQMIITKINKAHRVNDNKKFKKINDNL